jgi:DNA segregation ATPase FtsK/SpoIIIE, S-DNA-T family
VSEFLLRTLGRKMPRWLLLVALLLAGLARLLVFVFARWWLSWPLMLALGYWWAVGRYGAGTVAVWAVVAALVLVAALAGWSWLGPDSFGRVVVLPWRSWRRGRHYRARWEDAMDGAGLVRADVLPTLMSCHGGETVDELLVHMAPGSLVTEWRDAAHRLASAFEVRSVRVRSAGPRDVRLLIRHRAVSRHEWPADVEAEAVEVAAQPAPEPAEPIKPATGGAFPRRPR